MKTEEQIDSILSNLLKKGSNIDYLKELKAEVLNNIKLDIGLTYTLSSIAKEIKMKTEEFLSLKNQYGINYISGISTCIYFPDFHDNGEYKFKIIGGSRKRDSKSLKVNSSTLFDIASITKLFTLLLLFKLEEIGLVNLNQKISDINPDFQNLEDYTLNDLVRLHGQLRTNGDITNASTPEEAYEILKTLYLSSNSREENTYTDFGSIVISDTIEKIISKEIGQKVSFDEIMNEYLFKPLNMYTTTFKPNSLNTCGNENNLGLVHDPKARKLGCAVGHAGIFTTSGDLANLAKGMFSLTYINKKHLSRLGEITFPNSKQSNKGNLGIYVKHPLGYTKTFTPPEFSTGSFSSQGWTGSIATFDPKNLIHHNILVNSIYTNEDKDLVKNDKPIGFGDAFEEYQREIMKKIMLMYVSKKYYNKYCNDKVDIYEARFL